MECTKYFPTVTDTDYSTLSAFLTLEGPKRIADFINDPRWQAAINKHVEKLTGKQAFRWDKVPENAPMLRGLWVLQTKIDDDTGISEDKARLVGDGRRQNMDENDKLYAATPDADTTKLFTAIAVERDMTCSKFDVVGAYLEVPQPKPLYMWPPPGFPIPPECRQKGMGLLWLKVLNGQRDGASLWGSYRDKLFREAGLEECPSCPTFWKKEYPNNKLILLLVHADDGEIAADPGLEKELEQLLDFINTKFPIKITTPVGHMLGVHKVYSPGKATLDQEEYLTKKVLAFLEEPTYPGGALRTQQHPWNDSWKADFNSRRDPTPEELAFMKNKPYNRLVGTLNWLRLTRVDILFTVSKLGEHAANPRPVHWKAAQYLLQYLNSNRDWKIGFKKTGTIKITSFADSDLADDAETRRSRDGTLVMMSGGPIHAASKLQSTVADSTVASETISQHKLSKININFNNVLAWVGYEQVTPTIQYCDNQGAVRNCEEGAKHHQTKHIDIKYFAIRDSIRNGLITVKWCPTERMLADILTKGLGRTKHQHFMRAIGMFRGGVDVLEGNTNASFSCVLVT
jgi:hypothetical protein